jgi:hypothetical protein
VLPAGNTPSQKNLRGSLQATHPFSPINIQLYMTFLSSRYIPKWFSGKGTAYELLTFRMRSICPTDLILLDLIILIMTHEEYKFRISWKCSFLRRPLTSSFLVVNAFCRIMFSNTFNLHPPFRAQKKTTHPYRKKNGTIHFIPKCLLFNIRRELL